MDQKKTEKKEIVEIKDGKVEVTPDEDRVLELTGMAAVYGLPPVDCGGFFHRALPDAVYGDPLSG